MISVVVPVYNHAHTLERCFDSILAQTYRPLEIIIVNDGSTDDFAEVTNSFESLISNSPLGRGRGGFVNFTNVGQPTPGLEAFPAQAGNFDATIIGSVKILLKIINQQNQGASAARNRGFQEARGELIIFWDADTIGKPEMLERLKNKLDEHPEASYVYCQYKFGWKKMKSREFKISDLRIKNYIDTTSLVRRQSLAFPARGGVGVGSLGPFDESLKRFQDWDLWLTLLEQNKIGVFAPEILFKKIVNGRKGISSWLPSFVYRLPWKSKSVLEYEEARKIVLKKHRL